MCVIVISVITSTFYCTSINTDQAAHIFTADDHAASFADNIRFANIAAVDANNAAGTAISIIIAALAVNNAAVDQLSISKLCAVLTKDAACAASSCMHITVVADFSDITLFRAAYIACVQASYAAYIICAGNSTAVGIARTSNSSFLSINACNAAYIGSAFCQYIAGISRAGNSAFVASSNAAEILRIITRCVQSNIAVSIFNRTGIQACDTAHGIIAVNGTVINQLAFLRVDPTFVHACHAAYVRITVNRSAAVVRHIIQGRILAVSAYHTADIFFTMNSAGITGCINRSILAVAHQAACIVNRLSICKSFGRSDNAACIDSVRYRIISARITATDTAVANNAAYAVTAADMRLVISVGNSRSVIANASNAANIFRGANHYSLARACTFIFAVDNA